MRNVEALLSVTLALLMPLVLLSATPTAAQPADDFELIEDLDLGLAVTINLGTCDQVVPDPSFVLGTAQPLPFLALADNPMPLLRDEPSEDEYLEQTGELIEGDDLADEDVLAPEAAPPPIIWQLEEEIPAELDDLLEEPHVVVVIAGEDEVGYVACGEISEPAVEGEIVVALRQVDGSQFAGIALLEEENGLPVIGDSEVEVQAYVFHGLGTPPITEAVEEDEAVGDGEEAAAAGQDSHSRRA